MPYRVRIPNLAVLGLAVQKLFTKYGVKTNCSRHLFWAILHTLENMNKKGHGQDRRLVLLWTVTRRDDNFAHVFWWWWCRWCKSYMKNLQGCQVRKVIKKFQSCSRVPPSHHPPPF